MALPSRPLRALGLAALLTVTGTLHFAVPAPFIAIVPTRLPHKAELVALSGLAELASAALLAAPRTRSLGGLIAAATLVAVFPANVSMAMRSTGRGSTGRVSTTRARAYRIAVWARLPLQVPLVAWALSVVGRRAGGRARPG